jgi:hypothetical protein
MNERERALIGALAEESLDDETEAWALVESSDEARDEYRLQLAALEALSGVGSATMTESERAGLQRDLWTKVRAEKAKSRSTTGIYGWSLAAAALFVVVGLAALLGGGYLNQAQFGDAAAETFEETAADQAEGTESTTEAAAAPADEGSSVMSDDARARHYFAEEADRLRRGDAAYLGGEGDGAERSSTCLARADLEDHEVVAVLNEDGSAPVEGVFLVAVPEGETVGPDTPMQFVDADRCELVYTDE